MHLAVDIRQECDPELTRNNTQAMRASCQQRNDTAGIRVPEPLWACVHTYPQAERWAASNLRAKGYTAWLPLVTVRRRDRVVRTLWHQVEVPAFSRYVLVLHRPDEPWTPIRYTEGVQDLLKMGGNPAHANAGEISALQDALASHGTTNPADAGYSPGQALRWRHGAYGGLDAIVIRSDANHTTVAVVMLGALRQVTAPTSSLVPRD